MPTGVSAWLLTHVLEEAKEAGLDLDTATTKDVCDALVLPRTSENKCAFSDLFDGKTDPDETPVLADATVFVSHAWRYVFQDTINVMLDYEKEHPGTYFWFDLFINNQNTAVDKPYTWWTTTFKTSIESIGTTLLVFSPYNNPIPLTRCWCLLEILFSITSDQVQFLIRLPSSQIADFRRALLHNFDSILQQLSRIDAERAEAFNPHDQEMIFEAVRQSIGFSSLNNQVKDQLRQWLLDTGLALVAQAETALQEKIDDSEEKSKHLGEEQKEAHVIQSLLAGGDGHTSSELRFEKFEVALLCNQIGNLLDDHGQPERAVEYYKRCVSLLGQGHRQTAAPLNNVGVYHESRNEFDKAIEYFQQCLDVQLEHLGESHPVLGYTFNNLGSAYLGKSEYAKAIDYNLKALKLREEQLGPCNETATSLNNIGRVYFVMKDWVKAKEYYMQSLEMKLTTVPNHPSTSITMNNLGNLAVKQGNLEEAEGWYGKALPLAERALGPNHPHSLQVQKNLRDTRKMRTKSCLLL
eukprot:m.60651 g.60651  ORF g.60651 m.60651 type:complete len:523 (-) comp19207_c0_seq2:70-1638(-)